jgi:hypothetical protein
MLGCAGFKADRHLSQHTLYPRVVTGAWQSTNHVHTVHDMPHLNLMHIICLHDGSHHRSNVWVLHSGLPPAASNPVEQLQH